MGVSIVTNFYGDDIEPADAMANSSSYAMSDMYYQPPGTLPPMIQPFDPTASKPLMLLTASSDVKSGKELYDVAYYALRQMLILLSTPTHESALVRRSDQAMTFSPWCAVEGRIQIRRPPAKQAVHRRDPV